MIRLPPANPQFQTDHPLASTVEAIWLFAESGDKVFDLGPFGHHGTHQASLATSRERGEVGGYQSILRSNNDFIAVTGSDVYGTADFSEVSVLAIMRETGTLVDGAIAGKFTSSFVIQWGLIYDSASELIRMMGQFSESSQHAEASATLSPGWHQVLGTVDAVNDLIRLYIDGVLDVETNPYSGPEAVDNDGDDFVFGVSKGFGSVTSAIDLACVMVFRRELTLSEAVGLWEDPYGLVTPRRVSVAFVPSAPAVGTTLVSPVRSYRANLVR